MAGCEFSCRACCPTLAVVSAASRRQRQRLLHPHSSLRVGLAAALVAFAVCSMPPCSWRFFSRPASTSLATLQQAGGETRQGRYCVVSQGCAGVDLAV